MSVVEKATSFAELEEGLNSKISSLKIYSQIRGGWDKDTMVEINKYYKELKTMAEVLKNHKLIIQNAKTEMNEMKAVFRQIGVLDQRLMHMKNNLPPHVSSLQKGTFEEPEVKKIVQAGCQAKEVNTVLASINPEREGEKKGKTFRNIPKAEFITIPEYESVPKYIKGRIPYDKVNNAITEVNKAVEAKYNLMRKPRPKLSPIEMSLVASYKRQVSAETKGLYFVIDEDLKRFSNLKLDSSGRNILTILRTLKRLKEVRGAGNLTRLCIL